MEKELMERQESLARKRQSEELRVRQLLPKYVQELQELYGSHLKSVILFGSYARGDFNEDSDVDVLILLDLDDKGMELLDGTLCRVTYAFNMEHDIDIQIVTQNCKHFSKWRNAHSFYRNVMEDGVTLYAA